MKSRTKKLLSMLCVLALLISVVPVQMASAAITTKTLLATATGLSATGGTVTDGEGAGAFTFTVKSDSLVDRTKTIEGVAFTKAIGFSGKSEGKAARTVTFTTTEAATVKVWWERNDSSKTSTLTIWDATGKGDTTAGASVATGTATTENNQVCCDTLSLTKGATYRLGIAVGKGYIYRVDVSWGTADPKYAVSFAEMTNGSATADVTETEAGKTVTVTPVPAAGYVVDTVTTSPEATVTKQDNGTYTFTMPSQATTVTVTFKTGGDDEVVATVESAVKNALATWAVDNSLPQATWNPADAAAAKTEIEKVIGVTDGAISGVTAAVTIGSGFAAANAGSDENPLGTDGSVPYTIALSKGEASATVSSTVTITATAKMIDKTALTSALNAAKLAQGGVVASTDGTDVYASVRWIASGDTTKTALDTAITEGEAMVSNAAAKASEVSAKATELEEKTSAFTTAAKAGTKAAPTSGATAKTYTLGTTEFSANADTTGSSNKVIKGLGTDGVFSIHMGSGTNKIGDSNAKGKTFQGAPSGSTTLGDTDVRLNLGGQVNVSNGIAANAVGFVTSGPATVNIWWVEAGNKDREMIVLDATGAQAQGTNTKTTAGASTAQNAGAYSSMRLSQAGTYYLGGDPNKNYIFKVEVIVDAAAAEPTGVTVSGPAGLDEGTGTSVTLGSSDVTAQMSATVTAASGTPSQAVTWKVEPTGKGVSISDTGLVTVTPTATVGDYTVTATAAGTTVSGTRKLTVKGVVIDSVTIQGATDKAMTATYGDKLTLAAEVATSGGVIAGAEDKAVTWTSETTDVAEVNATTGAVTIKKAGTTKITATSAKDSTKKDEITLTVSVASVTLGIKTRNQPIDAAGREVVWKVGTPGEAENTVTNLPEEVQNGLTVKVTKDGGTDDLYASLGGQKSETADPDRPMPWNFKMTLPANDTNADQVYTVTVSFAGIAGKYAAAQDVSTTFTVKAPGAKTVAYHSQTGHGAQLTLTSGAELKLSLDAVVMQDGAAQLSDAVTFTWTKDDKSITAVDGKVTEEGEHKDHYLSTYTVAAVTTADAGVYKCVMTAEGAESQTATITVNVNKKAAEATPSATFEAATYTLSNVQSGWKYSLDGGTTWVDITGTSVTTDEAKTLREHGIKVMIPGGTEMEDAVQTIALTRAATPQLTAGDATITIVGYVAGTAYEYKTADGAWTAATVSNDGKITGLTNGTTYTVRVKGAGTVLPSETAQARPVEGAGDMTQLLAAIQTAKAAKTNVIIATKAEDVLATRKWVTQAEMDTFDAAISTAETASGQTGSTQTVIDAAKAALEQAISTFNDAKKDGTKVIEPADKTALEAAITAADDMLSAVTESADGAGLADGTKWAAKADRDAYQAAIEEARKVWADEEASSNQVTAAETALAAATTTFNGKIHTVGGTTPATKYGITVTAPVNGTVTTTPATEAEAGTEVTITATPTDGYVVDTTEVKDADNAAVAVTEGKFTMPAKAVTVTVTFKVKPVDKTALAKAIEDAKALDTTLPTSTDGSDIAQGALWVTEKMKTDLSDALTAAEAVADTATQAEVDAATKTLTDAIAAYQPAEGKKLATDVTSLDAAVKAAEKKMEGVEVSADGSDIDPEKTWVTEAAKTALTEAVEAAKAVVAKADAATEEEITAVATALQTASEAFVPAAGTKEPEVVEHTITVTAPANGTVKVSAEKAEAGTAVTITAKANSGYVVGKIEVKDASGATVTVTNNTFTMPDSNVTVTVTFTKETIGTGGSTASGGNPGVIHVNGDGSKTETVTNPDGSKTTTTTDKDGNKTVVTEAADGSKTEIVSKADGEKSITVTDASGEETVSVKVPAEVPAPETPFTDVPEDHWAKEAIDTIAGLGLVKGVDDVNHVYDMTSNITRGALANVLYRFSNGKAGLESSFSDVLAGAWYTDGVAWAAKVGVVNGYDDGTFGPDNAITRQELAIMLYRYAKLIGMDVSTKAELTRFNDSESVASWAKEAMTWCAEAGIVKGVGGNTLNPEGVASRAECAVMLSRFIDLV